MRESYTQSFETFFWQAAKVSPYPFQVRMATDAELPRLVQIPTGLGKTAAIVLGWIWRRQFADSDIRKSTPRRLVYCLPMRVLVEQTCEAVRNWLKNLSLRDKVSVHVLMGGEESEDWDLYPEREAILIGTQDMLLSRALNRGYGMSRYRWPMHFGLLNNDCLWVMDEVQLMDVGAKTSAQLDAFRRSLGMFLQTRTMWMSATLDPNWLHTIDVAPQWLGPPLELSEEEKKHPEVTKRYSAAKPIKKAQAVMGEEAKLADEIVQAHQPGTLTFAVFNTVARAQSVYKQLEIRSRLPKDVQLLLIHSRFRPLDRERLIKQLLAEPGDGGTIAVTTQVVEAGVDVSAKTLFTEMAPWASLVQRFGRCNRRGEFSVDGGGRVFWIDLPDDEDQQKKLAPPYQLDELLEARKMLANCEDVGPCSLEALTVPMQLGAEHVIRRRDFVDLFDTTPDLAGNDIDVSRFIRSGEDLDVQVFWREVPEDVSSPDPSQPYGAAPRREELCSVPVYELRKFLQKHKSDVWRWNPLEQRWMEFSNELIYPGQVFLVRASAGGYRSESGWDGSCEQKVEVLPLSVQPPDAYDEDWSSQIGVWETLTQHTEKLSQVLDAILAQLDLSEIAQRLLRLAARFHDLGKAHPIFQSALPDGKPSPADIWAKAPGNWKPYSRKHFRHELASALAVLQTNVSVLDALAQQERNLVAYLVATHHGKVRLSIRSLPGEKTPDDPERLYARGVWDGDELPAVDLGSGIVVPATRLSLEPMQLGCGPNGEPSWSERMLELRDDSNYGPLRLAYLEAILRAADMRASRNLMQRGEGDTAEETR